MLYVCMYMRVCVCILLGITLTSPTCSWRIAGVHKFFKETNSHLKLPGARSVTWSKFHPEDPQILRATVHTFVATATWRPHFCASLIYCIVLTKFPSNTFKDIAGGLNKQFRYLMFVPQIKQIYMLIFGTVGSKRNIYYTLIGIYIVNKLI
jgi:hypothetical protein